MKNTIGGYFELELNSSGENNFLQKREFYLFQSGRSAFYALLQKLSYVKKVWVPKYICNSMIQPILDNHKIVEFYDINEVFNVKKNINVRRNDIVVIVNYFGIHDINITLSNFEEKQIVIDNSQALFSSLKINCLATIYSPRKFIGVPDGGILSTDISIDKKYDFDVNSHNRMMHLLHRLDKSAESGRALFELSENSLEDNKPKIMSKLTEKLTNSVNMLPIKKRRYINYSFLNNFLETYNKINGLRIDENVVPMCYPFLTKNSNLRKILYHNKIYFPKYWEEVLSRVSKKSFEFLLVNSLLPIPCDQRYDEKDLKRIISVILNEDI